MMLDQKLTAVMAWDRSSLALAIRRPRAVGRRTSVMLSRFSIAWLTLRPFTAKLLQRPEPPAHRVVARLFHQTMTELLSAADAVNALPLFRAMLVDPTKIKDDFSPGQQDIEEVFRAVLAMFDLDLDLSSLVPLFEHRHHQTITHAWPQCAHSSVKTLPGVTCVNLPLHNTEVATSTSQLIGEFFGETRVHANCGGCGRSTRAAEQSAANRVGASAVFGLGVRAFCC